MHICRHATNEGVAGCHFLMTLLLFLSCIFSKHKQHCWIEINKIMISKSDFIESTPCLWTHAKFYFHIVLFFLFPTIQIKYIYIKLVPFLVSRFTQLQCNDFLKKERTFLNLRIFRMWFIQQYNCCSLIKCILNGWYVCGCCCQWPL